MSFNSASYSSKNINEHGNKSPVEDEQIIIVGTTPEISTGFSPIGINIVIPQTNSFSERKQYHNLKSCGQNNSSSYQPQPSTDSLYYQPQFVKYNQHRHYCQDRRTQQGRSKNDYDRYKEGKHENIHSVI